MSVPSCTSLYLTKENMGNFAFTHDLKRSMNACLISLTQVKH